MHDRTDDVMSVEERAHLRDQWEVLEAPDELEDAVADVARLSADEQTSPRPRLRLWMPAAGLAAAVLLLAIFAPRDPEVQPEIVLATDDEASDVPAGATTMWFPPSAVQVEQARAKHEADASGVPVTSFRSSLPARDENVVHRFVDLPAWNPGTKVTLRLKSLPRPLGAIASRAILEALQLDTTLKEVVLEVATVEAVPATTRLTFRVDPTFDGSVVVPHEVALGLGLQQFEVRGGAVLTDGHEKREGQRARVHVTAPYKTGTPVRVHAAAFVPRARRPQLASIAMGDTPAPAEPELAVALFGGGGLKNAIVGEGISWRAGTLLIESSATIHDVRGERPLVPVGRSPAQVWLNRGGDDGLALPTTDVGGEWGRPSFHVGRVAWSADERQVPVGSTFVASTIWRGTTASVGWAGCYAGTVKQAGRFEALLRADTDLAGLRAHVRRPDGVHVWVDAQIDRPGGRAAGMLQATDDRPLLTLVGGVVAFTADGTVSIPSPTPTDPTPEEFSAYVKRALASVKTRLAPLAERRLGAGGHRTVSSLELGIAIDKDMPWHVVSEVLQLGARLGIRTYRVQYWEAQAPQKTIPGIGLPRHHGWKPHAPETIRLPLDRGALALPLPGSVIDVRVRMDRGDGTKPPLADVRWTGPGGVTGHFRGLVAYPTSVTVARDQARAWWRKGIPGHADPHAMVRVVDGMQVPAIVVLDVARICREADITDVRFSAVPK